MNRKDKMNFDAAIENMTGVPCIVCGGPAYSLGVIMPEDYKSIMVPEGKSRLLFFNLCRRCSLDKAGSSEKACQIMMSRIQNG